MEAAAAVVDRLHRWRQWAQEAVEFGGGKAHRYAKAQPTTQVDPWVGDRVVVGQSAVNHAADQWHALWSQIPSFTEDQSALWTHSLQLARSHTLPPITPQAVAVAVRRYPKNKALGFDLWSARSWNLLEPEFFARLCHLYGLLEAGAELPPTWSIKTVLLPKPSGGSRPIQLLSAAMRIWAQLRLPIMQAWQTEHGLQAQVGGSFQPCDLAGVVTGLFFEQAHSRGEAAAAFFLDLEKAYERVDLTALLQQLPRVA
eukprot:2351172-Amphidinium_carterae.1